MPGPLNQMTIVQKHRELGYSAEEIGDLRRKGALL